MTQMATGADILVRYEGIGSGVGELWGATQANFLVSGGQLPAGKEVAVMLNDPAAAMLAEAAGAENTPEFRAIAAQRVGEAAIRQEYGRTGRVAAIVTVSRMTLESQPALLEALWN